METKSLQTTDVMILPAGHLDLSTNSIIRWKDSVQTRKKSFVYVLRPIFSIITIRAGLEIFIFKVSLPLRVVLIRHCLLNHHCFEDNPYWQTYFEDEDSVAMSNNQRVPDACPICYGSTANAGVRIRLECGHLYCKECLYEWIWRRNDCPTCRGGIPW